ncbi:hypothetical protein QMG61_05100 [Cryobacterium sp. PH31-AA6]|uniref:NACHT domain-containing protein n=1 Tax=Cryobacterium sp. PH31-AA6 TaxID=3046205 RepID=UPI0024BB1FFC|nr:hypothetical protein [Cryobacterium sp. PH31-AA6]MDJ0323139.1 hypothetical protein [Cryobacterium sp. PH31-AA6]
MSDTANTSNAGGAANELGSLHRNGFAAVLAAHGLSGTPLDGVDGRVPTAIALETADAVDDLVCTMENGERWFIQAKRSLNKASLRSTLRQWAAQTLGADDTLVLALRTVGGQVAGAMRVLDGRRLGRSPEPPAGDLAHFEAFKARVFEECGAGTDEILSHARIMAWEVEDVSDTRADSAIARMERVISSGSGPAAFRCLQAFFQRQSAVRTRTGTRDWIQALIDNGMDVAIDGLGTVAATQVLEDQALAEYRDIMASHRDRLDLAMISPRVPALNVDDFIASVDVEYDTGELRAGNNPLTHVLRRNGRLILRGLPGAGKSEAVRQVAAWLAAQPGAPLPLLVRLRDIATVVTSVDDVSLDLLIRTAASHGGREPSAPLMRALQSEIRSGYCVLLLDGLDETHAKRGTIAAGIAQVLSGLSTDVGVLLTTRESAMDAAAHVGLPVVDLKPLSSRKAQVALIEAYAAATLPEADREEWCRVKLELISPYADSHRDIWEVPLLATLATLRLLDGNSAGDSAGELLKSVIEDSINRWEVQRFANNLDAPDPGFSPGMFLDGFAVIGRALNANATLSVSDARQLVVAALSNWALSHRSAERIAEFVVTFWDETVGVFVDTGQNLQPRSRVFAELGDAYAAVRLDSVMERQEWLTQCLDNPERANALALATSADVDIARWLIAAAAEEVGIRRARAARWMVESLPSWSSLTDADVGDVMSALSAAAMDRIPVIATRPHDGILATLARAEESKDRDDGLGWRFAVELASLPVPLHLRPHKDALLDKYVTDPDRSVILRALCDLVVAADSPIGVVNEPVVDAIERALAYPLAEYRDVPPSLDRFGTLNISTSNGSPPAGLDRVAMQAAHFATHLTEAAVDRIWDISIRLPAGKYNEVRRTLTAAGYESPHEAAGELSWLAQTRRDEFELGWFLPYLTGGEASTSEIAAMERWRMCALSDLVDFASLGTAAYWELREASKTPASSVEVLLRAAIGSAQLSHAAVRVEAIDVRRVGGAEHDDLVSYLFTPRLQPAARADGAIPEGSARDLIAIVAGRGKWASDLACDVLMRQSYPSVCDAAREVCAANWHSERNLAFVRLLNAPSAAHEATLLMAEGGGARAATGLYLAADDTDVDEELLLLARADSDGTVRDAAGATLKEVLAARHWTCIWCFEENPISAYVCGRCEHSSSNSLATHKNIREYVKQAEARGGHDS